MIPKWAIFLTEYGESIDVYPFNPLAPFILLLPVLILRRRGKSIGYLMCFSLFYFYLWAVCAYAICPLPVADGLIEWQRGIDHWSNRVNLRLGSSIVDWNTGSVYTDDQVSGNFLLGAPFGFGLPFLVRANARRMLKLCFYFAAGLEGTQLAVSALIYRFPYRSIDVDDVLLVFLGAAFGYGVLRLCAAIYRRIGWEAGARVPVWGHFHAALVAVTGAPKGARGEGEQAAPKGA